MKKGKAPPLIPELIDQFEKGKLTRRGFLRYAARLGLSVSAASSLIGLPSFGKSGHCQANPVESNFAEIRNEILHVYQEQNLNIFWGDMHGHTGFSDGYGLPEEYFSTARNINNLDFTAITDHAEMINHYFQRLIIAPGEKSFWEMTIDAVNENYEPGRFATILGFEWTGDEYGHRNVYFRDTVNVPSAPLGCGRYKTPEDLWDELSKYDAFTIPHHVMRWATLIDTSYKNNEIERLVEIHSKWGCSGWPYADYEPMWHYVLYPQLRKHASGHSVFDMLNQNFIVGIIGSTDTHQGLPGSTTKDVPRGVIFNPDTDPIPVTVGDFMELLEQGYTLSHVEPPYGGCGPIMAVFSEDLTRENIWDSMYKRHTYASTGARASVYFIIKDTADNRNRARMGDEIYIDGNPEILVYVEGEYGSIVERIQIIKNGKVILARKFGKKDIALGFEDTSYDGSPSYYVLRVIEKQGESYNHDDDYEYDERWNIIGYQLDEILWSSPIWVYQAK
jgi:hypothetical protein